MAQAQPVWAQAPHTPPHEVLTFLVACFTTRRTSSGRMLWTSLFLARLEESPLARY